MTASIKPPLPYACLPVHGLRQSDAIYPPMDLHTAARRPAIYTRLHSACWRSIRLWPCFQRPAFQLHERWSMTARCELASRELSRGMLNCRICLRSWSDRACWIPHADRAGVISRECLLHPEDSDPAGRGQGVRVACSGAIANAASPNMHAPCTRHHVIYSIHNLRSRCQHDHHRKRTASKW